MNFLAIYKIVNRLDPKYYVGSNIHIHGREERWYQHRYYLNKNTHRNLKSFCKSYELYSGNMYHIASGKKSQHKEWRKYELPES
jgi:hypothetical protein